MAVQYDGWSIVAQYRRCGKAGCKTCSSGSGHGPYFYGTKIVDGRRISKYFGKKAPMTDTQDSASSELERLKQENARLHETIARLREQLEALVQRDKDNGSADILLDRPETPSNEVESTLVLKNNVVPHANTETEELNRAQVESIWQDEAKELQVSDEVVAEAHEHLMRGLFRDAQEHTRLKVGRNTKRPYVCPFRSTKRGSRLTFGSADRLVRTVVPWIIEYTAQEHIRTIAHQNSEETRLVKYINRYNNMNLAELRALAGRMEESINAGSTRGWALNIIELQEQIELIRRILASRKN